MKNPKTKICNKCKKSKPVKDFGKNNKAKDKLHKTCKECLKKYQIKHIISKGKKPTKFSPNNKTPQESHNCNYISDKYYTKIKQIHLSTKTGLDSWTQIESVLREMSELQSAVDEQTVIFKNKIARVESYLNETIEPWLLHQLSLKIMLEIFLKKELGTKKRVVRQFAYGKILWDNGSVNIELNTKFAKERLEKP